MAASPVDVLMIDNYDSFTFNVVQYLEIAGARVTTVRNDAVTLEEVEAMRPRRIVISPGPGAPRDAGISCDVIRRFAGRVPILGVCLGLQCMFEVFGGVVAFAGEIMHGKTSAMTHDGKGLFAGVPTPFQAVRYHSLAGVPSTLPPTLGVTCSCVSGTGERIIQGVRHTEFAVEGVQFHPESIVTEHGHAMFRNFLAWDSPTWVGGATGDARIKRGDGEAASEAEAGPVAAKAPAAAAEGGGAAAAPVASS